MGTVRNGESVQNLTNRALISDITGKALLLAKKEIELAKAEFRADMDSEVQMATALAIAGVVAIVGLNVLLVAVILALTPVIAAWLAALIIGGALLGIGALVGYIGWRRHVRSLLRLTRQTLKEDLQWMKERVA
jgi:uncharacterized membrane protein YqjE